MQQKERRRREKPGENFAGFAQVIRETKFVKNISTTLAVVQNFLCGIFLEGNR